MDLQSTRQLALEMYPHSFPNNLMLVSIYIQSTSHRPQHRLFFQLNVRLLFLLLRPHLSPHFQQEDFDQVSLLQNEAEPRGLSFQPWFLFQWFLMMKHQRGQPIVQDLMDLLVLLELLIKLHLHLVQEPLHYLLKLSVFRL